MQAALIGVNQRFASRAWPSLRVGIGINTGTMVGRRHGFAPSSLLYRARRCGEPGFPPRRLVGAVRCAGVIIGEATYQALGEWRCRQLDRVTVRGRTTPVAIYEPL
jgi:adenylate cyclase